MMEDRKVKAVKFRGFNKSNLLNWLILLEKNGFVMCSFKNCNFMAFDIDGMADHYSRCNSDKSNIKFNCEYCPGGIDTEDNLLKHKVLHHPQHAHYKDFSDFNDKEHSLFPTSVADREVSYVMKRSWQVFLETKKYIKCLVQTCLYVANTIDQMSNHHQNYCTPHYRDQLTFTCFTCQGRTDSLSDLKTHCRIAHPMNKTETNKITPSIIHHWSELLHEFNWAKCFNPKCNFIECDISTLKVHYSTCTNPSKEGLVECSKCRGWLNGFTRLRKHIKMAHNPYNPRPIVYMVPVKLVEDKIVPVSDAEVKRALSSDPNSVLCEDLFYKTQMKTNLKITNGTEVIECPENNLKSSQLIQKNKPGVAAESPKIFDCSEEDNNSRINPIYNCDYENDTNPKIVNGKSNPPKSGPCDKASKNVEPPRQFGGGSALTRSGITSHSESDPDEPDEIEPSSNPSDNLPSPEQNDEKEKDCDTVLPTSELEPPVRGDGLKTYTHNITANKKLPHFYPAFIPRTTFEIDCSKAQRNQVTFSKDIINTNEWKLELPHVSLRTRNNVRRQTIGVSKVVKSTLSKIAQEMTDRQGPLVPVAIKINEMDTSWTVHVPSLNLKKKLHPKIDVKTESQVSTKTNFKEAYWDNVQADMMELLKISVKNSSIRNTVRYHKHKTRSRMFMKEEVEDTLFKHDVVKEDELTDDPRKDLGITSDVEVDTDSDDLYIDEPVDLLSDDFYPHEPDTCPSTKEPSTKGSWCVKLVEPLEVAEGSKKSANNDSNKEHNKIGQSVDNDKEALETKKDETSVPSKPSTSANNQNQTTSKPSNARSTQLNDESPLGPKESGTNPRNKVDKNDSQKDSTKEALLGEKSESLNADLQNQEIEYSKDKSKKPEDNSSEPNDQDLPLDFSGVKPNQEEVSSSSSNNKKEKVNGADLTSSCRQEVSNAKPSFVCSDGIHCGTDDESVDSPPPAVDCDGSIEHESSSENSKSAPQSNPTSATEEGSVSNQSQESHRVPVKKEFDTPDFSEGDSLGSYVEPSNVSLGSTSRAKGRKRKNSNATHSENDATPKLKHVRPSSSNLVISDKIESVSLGPAVTITPVRTSTKRKSGRPRKKSFNDTPEPSEISELLWPISGGESSTPNRKGGRKRTPKISPMANVSNQSFNLNFTPEGHSSLSSIGDSVIIPDQDLSTINQNSPVPSAIVNMDEVVSQKQNKTRNKKPTESVVTPQRKPKNKRSTDVMAALGDRITPTSPLTNPNKKVTCAVCSQSMAASEYQKKHLKEHNFLCWLTTEMPLPLEDFNTMVLVASRGKRAHPEHVFTCDKCERPSKSASGYLCHIRFCGKSKDEADSLMVVCDQCNRLFKPNCIDQHVRSAHTKNALTPEQAASINAPSTTRLSAANSKKKISEIVGILLTQDDVEKSIKPNTPSKSEPSNRVITKKLLKSWKEADAKGSPLFCPITNCDFRCNCFDTIQSHYRACNPLDPTQQVFMCKLCPYQTNYKEYYLAHMKEEHCLLVHLPENVAYYPIKFLKDLEDDMYCSFTWVRCTTVFKPCLHLTKELKDKYFSKESLFPDMLVGWENWTSLEDDNPAYQPNYHTSPAIRYNSTNEWLRLPCYSAASFKGESLLWTGGSVHSMAWCPTPPNVVTDQFLAISCLLNLNNVFTIGNTYVHPTTVQLWNYGSVLNSEWLESSADTAKTPSLSYALCINEGPVWDLEWCPSGCYDLRRIGLLACATASGAVNIYTLPHPNQLNIPTERCPLFKGVPTLRLLLSRNESFQCQKISWSKVKPHKLIAGGFVNGIVAIWDLSVTSTFLREGSVLYPCRLFQAHHSTVTCLKMCPVDSNFVVSGSLDKYIKLWDLRDVSNPVHSMVRGGITDLDWLVNWLGYSFGMDAGLTPSPSSVFFSSVRDFSFIPTPLIGHPTASVKSISGSDWLNCFATGYDDGNVILTSCLRQFGDGSEAKKKIAKFILRTELVDLSKEKVEGVKEDVSVPEDSSSYEDTINMFGIRISTSKAIEDKGKMDTVEEPRNDVYPIHSVTKVCFNPNQPSFLTLAVGFESGFISTLQLLPSRQVFSDIQVLCSKNSPNLSEDYKF